MIIGVDIGTTVTKAASFASDGTRLASASRQSRVHRLSGGRAEQDFDHVLSTVINVIREITTDVTNDVEAIAITGQGDGLWLRDNKANPTHAPISWTDGRAADLVASWRAGGSDSVMQRVYALTGSGIFPGCHAALLAHLDRHDPQVLSRASVAGYCVDAVVQRLTGDITVDASDASLPFLNVANRRYVDDALDICGVRQWRHLLPEPAPPHALHSLTDEASHALGLPSGTPVSAGPYDLEACSFGSGTLRPGDGTLVLGTTLSCQVITTDCTVDPFAEPAGMWLCTPDPQTYLRVMPSMAGTASIDWLLSLMNMDYESVGALLGDGVPGANGVRSLSFLSEAGERAPFVDPSVRGQFSGITLSTTAADMIRAGYESIAFAARNCFESLGLEGDLAACGGGFQVPGIAQIMADVLNRTVNIPDEGMLGARGAAAVACQALGLDVDAWPTDRRAVRPQPQHRRLFEDAYRQYLDDVAHARGHT